ncbi:site-specific DNA-methyltransferase [Polymorphobacter arshaanensis]|uniref:site-specific DNA-methyltransferase (adenine-specific) n=1 Tax=Glacieibacterium arshaanense TaxID=2511025 RepID=A0A4Y9ES30_9SPHN|nr:DNA methyltransferase [Polymorphobacter arshaanensis]TFU06160.1 site-specific DNA-methyltransferase [Polymorphobacter arshaanensis]
MPKDSEKPIRRLYFGDNLSVMGNLPDGLVDLVYLDPPFNSDEDYNVFFQAEGLDVDEAQWTAFKDTWVWDKSADEALELISLHGTTRLATLIDALKVSLGKCPMMAYLVNMGIRLTEIHRIMKDTGSLYLHCDPNASHYLKLILDAIFGPTRFRSEIIWRRTGSHGKSKRWAPIHDTILYYTKSDVFTWNNPKRPYMRGHVDEHFIKGTDGKYRTDYYGNVMTGSGVRNGTSAAVWRGFDPTSKGRHWAIPGDIWNGFEVKPDIRGKSTPEKLEMLYEAGFITIAPNEAWPLPYMEVDPSRGVSASDLWTFQPYTGGTVFGTNEGIDEDVRWLSPKAAERLGYPTQKPLSLLGRIIEASSNKGDVVFDPFCGCGTTIEASERLQRQWIGIDISSFAIQLIKRTRLGGSFPGLEEGIGRDYEIDGLPKDMTGAEMLALRDRKAFEIWAVTNIDAKPNEKKGADGGVDGRIPFKPNGFDKAAKWAAVSVKSGEPKLSEIRDLHGVTRSDAATMGFGVFVCLREPTGPMRKFAREAGTIELHGNKYDALQILTIQQILNGERPRLPYVDPSVIYKKAAKSSSAQGDLLSVITTASAD